MSAPRPYLTQVAFALVWLFIFSVPSEKAIELSEFGTMSRILGLIAFGGAVLAVAARGKFRVPGGIHVLLACFVLWSVLSYRWSISPELTMERMTTYLQLFAVVLMVWELCESEWQILALLDAYILGTLPSVVQTLERFLSGTETYYQRYATNGFDPNDFALTLALSLPMSFYLVVRRAGWRRGLYAMQMAGACGAILLSASRGGTLAMIVGLSVVPLCLPALPRRQRWCVSAIGLTLALTAASFVPATSWQRLMTLTSEIREGTLNQRTVLWQEGWQVFGDVPYRGVGAGAYAAAMEPLLGQPWGFTPVAHNSYLSVLVETGVVGFLLFGGFLTYLVYSATRLPWVSQRYWLVQLAVWGLGVSSLTWEHRKPTWFLFGLLIAHAAGSRQPEGDSQTLFAGRLERLT